MALLGVGKDLSGKVSLVLTNPPWNVWRGLNDGSLDYDVFQREDMKNVVKVLESVMNPDGHAHGLRLDLRIAFWYKVLVLEKREQRAGTGEDVGKPSSERNGANI